MWVIYFQGKPAYWLTCNKLYTVGRKDTDVVILEDNSISRHHLSVNVGAVHTIAALGRHLIQASQKVSGAKSPQKPQHRHDHTADEDDYGVESLHSVTNVAELAQLYPAAPLSFQDLSKYGSTLEYHDPSSGKHVAVRLRGTVGGGPIPSQAAPGTGGASYTTPGMAAAPDIANNANASPAVVFLPLALQRCTLRVGTHEAVFEFRWEPTFILLGEVDSASAGNSGIDGSASTSEWVMSAVAKCGFVVLNASATSKIGARRTENGQAENSETASSAVSLTTRIVPHTLLPTHILRLASFLVAPEIIPTPLLMAVMCASKPVVGYQFLENILARISPKVPLPDPTSTLSTPKKIHAFFSSLLGGTASASADQLLPSVFLARSERSTLFSFTTFVAAQRAVFDELKAYIPLADGHIVFDDIISQSVSAIASANKAGQDGKAATAITGNDIINHSTIDSFYLRHSHRVLVYIPPKDKSNSSSSSSLDTKAAATLIAAMGQKKLPSVEYTSVLSAIVRARKLDIPLPSATRGGGAAGNQQLGGKRARDSNNEALLGGVGAMLGEGRRTEGGVMFNDDDDDVQPTIDVTLTGGGKSSTPQQRGAGGGNRSPATTNNHNKNRLLAGESKWKSRDELRAQTSVGLFPDNDADGDDTHNGNHFAASNAASRNDALIGLAASRSRQLVAHDPLSGNKTDAAGGGINLAQREGDSNLNNNFDDDDDYFGAGLPPAEVSTASKIVEEDGLVISGPPPLPAFPCFQRYLGGTVGTGTTSLRGMSSAAAVPSGNFAVNTKTFKKQFVLQSASIIELEADVHAHLPAQPNAAPQVFRAADDDDIIPQGHHYSAMDVPSVTAGRFNPFDVSVHNQQQRRAGRVTATATLMSTSPAVADAAPPSTTSAARGRGRGRGRGTASATTTAQPRSSSPATTSSAPQLTGRGAAKGAASAMMRAARNGESQSQELGLVLGRNVLNATADSQAADIFDVDNLY